MAMTVPKSKNAESKADETAKEFEALFQTQWEKICALLYRMLGSWDEAQDLALESFEQLYLKPPKKDHNLEGWLYRVATNKGLNALRAQKRRQHYEHQAGSLALESNQPGDPAQILEWNQERQLVRLILRKMKRRHAKLLALRYSGLSYSEIAAALGVSPTSVGTLLTRAEEDFAARYSRELGDAQIGASSQKGENENAS